MLSDIETDFRFSDEKFNLQLFKVLFIANTCYPTRSKDKIASVE
jgi:hypothetical protein